MFLLLCLVSSHALAGVACLPQLYNHGQAWRGVSHTSHLPGQSLQTSFTFNQSGTILTVSDSIDGPISIPVQVTCNDSNHFKFLDQLPQNGMGHMQMSGEMFGNHLNLKGTKQLCNDLSAGKANECQQFSTYQIDSELSAS